MAKLLKSVLDQGLQGVRPQPMPQSSTAVATPTQPMNYTQEQRKYDDGVALDLAEEKRAHELKWDELHKPVLTNNNQIGSPERREAFGVRRPRGAKQ